MIRFGTDGVRGLANSVITVPVAVALGRATARTFAQSSVVIGRDTRRSGSMLEGAVAAGVCSEGSDAVVIGVVATPTVAAVAARDDIAGIMISASHNPFADNGLKVFAPGGRKLTDDEQSRIEAEMHSILTGAELHLPAGAEPAVTATVPVGSDVGEVRGDPTAVPHYLDRVRSAVDGRSLSGLSVVLDCANGSNSHLAPEFLRSLGAEVVALSATPDGLNINDGCGSTHPAPLAAAVLSNAADVGIAFDGDADRLVAVDHTGRIVDGDHIIALCAQDLSRRGELDHNTVVVTVMSNLGFHHAMAHHGIEVVQTPVGDRHVLEALARGGYALGGEQSGHIIFSNLSTTGDGLLSAVVLLDVITRAGCPLAELADAAMTSLPQVLVNVAVAEPMPDVAARLRDEIDQAATALGDEGRVLLRPSGTEPVVRVMVEAPTADQAQATADTLAGSVARLGGSAT